MMTSRNGMQDVRATSIAEAEANKSSARSKKATSRVFLVLRIVLFVLACVFSVIGIRGFIEATNTQVTSQTVTVNSIQEEPVAHALVVMSYDESDADTAYEREGVMDVLARSSISADVVYLDARAGSSTTEARVTTEIKEKAIAAGGYDAIIAAGDDALNYVATNQDLFGRVPTAFFAVTDVELAQAVQAADIGSGYVEVGAPALSLQNAVNMKQGVTRAIVLVDGSLQAAGLLQQLQTDPSAAPGVERVVWDVSTMTRDELAASLGDLGSGDVVLLLAANRDVEGNSYSSNATAHFLAQATSTPVFSATGGVGEGVCGAAFIDRQAEGSDAAMCAVSLLNGAKASSVAIAQVQPACSVFDVQALEAHGVSADNAPENATFINESALSWRVLRPFAKPLLFLLAAIACVIGFGVMGFRRSMRSNRAIIESRDDLQYRLYHDLLTDLPNRQAVEQLAADSAQQARVKSAVQIDLDDFTALNDSYGHSFGNKVLVSVAERLRHVDAALLARTGGDEFALAYNKALSPGCRELEQVTGVFSEPFDIDGNKVSISACTGVANREAGMTSEDLIVYSDLAASHAKELRTHVPVFYSEGMREGVERKVQITSRLRQAIAENEITVVWQPQVDVQSLQVVGYEALCRLVGNDYYPGDFIPVAEMSGLIVPIDRLVTEQVVAQLGSWLREGRQVGVVSINYSAAQLRDKDYCDFVADLLQRYGVPGNMLKIEFTESMTIGNEEAADELFARLAQMGVPLALDDFGTGYSSLSRMAALPVDCVKLDKSLVDTFMVKGKEGFIEHVTKLVHDLGKKVVVEGVETYEQYEMCRQIGCDVVQGYFFARPVDAQAAVDFDPHASVSKAKAASGDKTRNADWRKYERDENGRWKKSSK